LAAYREESALAEKILRILRDPRIWQGGDAEHFTRALAIAGRDDGRVDIDEIPLLEKPMHRIRHPAAHPEHRAVEVRPRAQVGDGAEEFRAVAFFLQGVVIRHFA